jgi:hypothetical protein
MLEEVLKAIPVFLFSMVKFILGPTLGFAAGLHFFTTMFVTVGGMMTVVSVFTYFGEWLKAKVFARFIKNRKRFTPRSRRFVRVWKKVGMIGIALLTPVVLTPLGGTLLAVSSGSSRQKIMFYMLVSASIWSLIFTSVIYFLGKEFLPEFVK